MARRSKVIPQLASGATTSSLSERSASSFILFSGKQKSTFSRILAATVSCVDSPLGFQQHIHGIRPSIPEIEPDAPVWQLRDRRGNGAGGQIPNRRKDDGIARPPNAAAEHQVVPFQPVAGRSSVSLGNSQAHRL